MRLIKAALCIQVCQTAPRVNCRQFEGDQLQGKAPTPTSLLSSTHPKNDQINFYHPIKMDRIIQLSRERTLPTTIYGTEKIFQHPSLDSINRYIDINCLEYVDCIISETIFLLVTFPQCFIPCSPLFEDWLLFEDGGLLLADGRLLLEEHHHVDFSQSFPLLLRILLAPLCLLPLSRSRPFITKPEQIKSKTFCDKNCEFYN